MSNSTAVNNISIVAIILSGGAGRRIGGLDKGLQLYKKKPLIEHVINSLKGQVSSFILCVNRNQENYLNYGYPVVEDLKVECLEDQVTNLEGSSFNGPMAGVNAAAAYIQNSELGKITSHILLSSCDSPALPEDYVARLLDQLRSSGEFVAVAHDGERKQNLHSLIKIEALPSLQEYYLRGGRAMHRWYQEIGMLEVDFSDQAAAFLNINRPEQLKES